MERPGHDESAEATSRAPADVPVRSGPFPLSFRVDGGVLTIAFGAVLPALGVLAGLTTSDLGAALAPTWFDVAAVFWACGAVALLEVRRIRSTPVSSVDHAVLGSALGVAGVYCAICLPLVPLFAVACVMLVGFLAFAPYWNAAALLSSALHVVRRTREARWSRGRVWAIFVVAASVYPGIFAWRKSEASRIAGTLVEVGLREPASGRRLGSDAIPDRWSRSQEDRLLDVLPGPILLGAAQLVDPRSAVPGRTVGRSLGDWPIATVVGADSARLVRRAYFRGHGAPVWTLPVPAFEPETAVLRVERAPYALALELDAIPALVDDPGASDAARGPLADLQLVRSEIRVDPDTAAGPMVAADWRLVIANHAGAPRQTRVQFRLPPGAFVDDLRLLVGSEWRPAVFAADRAVVSAYREVARPREITGILARDPALLRQVSPDRYRLVVYPVPAKERASVEIRLSLPVRSGGGAPALALPAWIDRDATWRSAVTQRVRIGDGAVLADFDAQAVRDPGRMLIPWSAAREVAPSTVAEGLAGRWPAPGRRAALVVDAFHGHGARIGGDLVGVVPAAASVRVIHDGEPIATSTAGLPEVVRRVGFRAPFDRFAATIRTLLDWCGDGAPVDVLWIHGASTLEPAGGAAVDTLIDVLRGSGSRIVALPATPTLTPNTLVERLVAAGVAVQAWATGDDLAAEVRALARGTAWLHGNPEPATGTAAPPPTDAVSAAPRIRALLASEDPAAHRAADDLAASHRIVTPRVGAVVLETDRDYAEQGLTPPGKPPQPAGSAVPEWSTWILILTGVVLIVCRARRDGSKP